MRVRDVSDRDTLSSLRVQGGPNFSGMRRGFVLKSANETLALPVLSTLIAGLGTGKIGKEIAKESVDSPRVVLLRTQCRQLCRTFASAVLRFVSDLVPAGVLR